MPLSSTSPASAATLAWILLISVGVVSGDAPGAKGASELCNLGASAATEYLAGKHLRVGFYSGELSNIDDSVGVNDLRRCKPPCNGTIYPKMTGYDIDLLDKLAGLGGFTYSMVHVGKAAEIKAGNMSYTNRAKWLLGVTNTAHPISDEQGRELFDPTVLPGYGFGVIDIMGQGTWRVNAERINWAVFANAVVSEEARFVTRAAATSGMTYDERVLFLFKPFTVEVWLILLAAVVAHALTSWMIERDSHKKKVSEKKAKYWRAQKRLTARDAELKELTTSQPTKEGSGPIRMGSTYEDNVERREADHKDAKKELKNLGFETFYHACISCGGEHHYDPESTELRVVNVGWVFFVFLIGSIYSANLTAILTLGPEKVEPYSGLDRGDNSCIQQDCTFCVKDGAANHKFFNETYGKADSLNVEAVESIKAQIENLASSGTEYPMGDNKRCDAIELTAEDFWKWGKNMRSSIRCKVEVQGAIVKRPRGMMAPVENACVITGINALYHKFTTQKSLVDGGNADDLRGKHFPVQTCPETDERANLKISIDQLAGAFGLVLLVLLYGIIHHFCGKAIRREFRKVTGQKRRREGQSWSTSAEEPSYTRPVDDLDYPSARPVLRNKSMAEPMFGVATDANADIDTESDDDIV